MSLQSIKSSRSLRLTLRFVVPLVAAMALLAYAVVPLVDKLTLRWSVRDMDIRSKLVTSTLQEPLGELLEQGNKKKIQSLLARATQDERLFALGYCDVQGNLLFKTRAFPDGLGCSIPDPSLRKTPSLLELPQGLVHVAVNPFLMEGMPAGSLVLLHDMSFFRQRSEDTRKYLLVLFAVLSLVTSVITVLIAHLSWRGWMTGVRALLRGEGLIRPFARSSSSELQPLVGDLRALLRTMDAEKRMADDLTLSWNPDSLRSLLFQQLAGEQILVVSNREPYIHMKGREGIEIQRPASGLVTAVEPVLRACSGIWIAHGSGTADREVVDQKDYVRVPPEHPEYTLRRIWLTEEEEKGYYYGLANEGLWPLCHIAHVRPISGPETGTGTWRSISVLPTRWREAERDDQSFWFRTTILLCCRACSASLFPGQPLSPSGTFLAESGILRHLPLARRNPARHAGKHDCRFSHAFPLQEFPGNRGPLPRNAGELRVFHDFPRRQSHAG